MRILVIEDEIYSFNNLRKNILEIEPYAKIDGPITSVEDMENILVSQDDYDIIFSDIRLDDGLCFEALANVDVRVPLIFTTAYDEYALKAFQNNGIDYLLKPIDIELLRKSIIKATQMKRGQQNISNLLQSYGIYEPKNYRTRFLVQDFNGAHVLEVQDISHIVKEKDKIYAYLYNMDRQKMQGDSLDYIEMLLNPKVFFRVNRQYIVNVKSIKKIYTSLRQTLNIELKHYPDLVITVSKEKASKLKEWIES